MKTLFVLFFTVFTLVAQAQHKNTIFLSTQPGDYGLGLRYDRQIHRSELYGTVTRGNYRLAENGYIKDHYRTSLGYGKLLRSDENDYGTIVTLGAVYHSYGSKQYILEDINEKRAFSPLSVEAGIVRKLNRFNLALRMDLLKWEGCVDFGISF